MRLNQNLISNDSALVNCHDCATAGSLCPCGHHEGYHNDAGVCLQRHKCGCAGLPTEAYTPDEEFFR